MFIFAYSSSDVHLASRFKNVKYLFSLHITLDRKSSKLKSLCPLWNWINACLFFKKMCGFLQAWYPMSPNCFQHFFYVCHTYFQNYIFDCQYIFILTSSVFLLLMKNWYLYLSSHIVLIHSSSDLCESKWSPVML